MPLGCSSPGSRICRRSCHPASAMENESGVYELDGVSKEGTTSSKSGFREMKFAPPPKKGSWTRHWKTAMLSQTSAEGLDRTRSTNGTEFDPKSTDRGGRLTFSCLLMLQSRYSERSIKRRAVPLFRSILEGIGRYCEYI